MLRVARSIGDRVAGIHHVTAFDAEPGSSRDGVLALFALLVVLLSPVVGIAQASQPPQTPAATDGFVPVTDLPPTEQLPAAPMVIGAYAFIWVAVLVYVGLLWKRLGVVQKELDALARRIPPRS